MTITLTAHGTTVELPADLYWSDEHAWSEVAQSVERSVTGELDIQAGRKVGGRPITLGPWNSLAPWMPRSTVDQLNEWAQEPGLEIVLTLRGVSRIVLFRHHEAPVIDARPVQHYDEMLPTDPYICTTKLMELVP